jgi:hypothetical protein
VKILKTLLLVLLFSSTMAGCGSSETKNAPPKTPGSIEGAPSWVTGDCRKHFGSQQIICGVGSVSGVTSPALARNAAMGRGRTEIARYLQVRVKSILADYQAVKGGANEQVIEENSKQITDMSLSGTRMAEYFIAPDGTYYALVTLGIDEFKSTVAKAPGIEEPIRQTLIENATKAFSVQDDETSRY